MMQWRVEYPFENKKQKKKQNKWTVDPNSSNIQIDTAPTSPVHRRFMPVESTSAADP